jgi:hypothetical protein
MIDALGYLEGLELEEPFTKGWIITAARRVEAREKTELLCLQNNHLSNLTN